MIPIEKAIPTEKHAITVRREIKHRIGAPAHLPIYIKPYSNTPPHVINEDQKYGWYTYGGDYVRWPAAYAKKGFSYLTYIADPREIVVGEHWLRRFAGGKIYPVNS